MSTHTPPRFTDKIVVITGGNSGIGLGAARAFAAEGARLVITGRDEASLKATASEIGHRIETAVLDVTHVPAIENFMRDVGTKHGRIDVLFVNAGTSAMLPIEGITEEIYDQILNANLKGAFFTVRAALPFMHAGSAIVFNASLAARRSPPGGSAYAASKAGVVALGRTLADEFASRGIRVNVVSPGPIETPLPDRTIGVPPEAGSAIREMMSRTPLGRVGTTAELARAVLFLASDEASFITGTELLVDGGIASR